MRKFGLFMLAILFAGSIFAKPVSSETAMNAAHSFLLAENNVTLFGKAYHLELQSTLQSDKSMHPAIYIFNINSSGFIIISGDDAAYPVLGYSDVNAFGAGEVPVQMQSMLESFVEQIDYIRSNGIEATTNISNVWNDLLNNTYSNPKPTGVQPLLSCLWDQGAAYNALCPEDPEGPGGRVYAGCVATMMGMTMYYYRYPRQGSGSHGYNSNYGYLSVDFSQSYYNYEQMPTQLAYGNYDVAKLLYDCGVAIDMNYSPYGSGAYMHTTLDAMKSYFGYNPSSTLEYKDNYTEPNWKDLLKTQLDAGYPIPYAGYDVSSGHAFVCDGYEGDMFHFNWGWSGSFNGYFYINNLNPGYNFSTGQQAFIDCYPASVSYPSSCGNYDMTSRSGSISSGNSSAGYLNDQSCSWYIHPADSVSFIDIEFKRFNTEAVNDLVSIYQGSSSSDPLIGTYSGDSLPNDLSIQGEEVFITFTSNASIPDDGFLIDYFGNVPVYCNNLTLLYDQQGTITDGSNSYPYNDNTMCRWRIEPPGAAGVQIDFIEFDLESNMDFLSIYDITTNPYTLIAQLTGSSLPQSVFANTPRVMVIFKSDDSNTEAGFKFNYHGVATGIEEESALSMFIFNSDDNTFLQLNDFPEGLYNVTLTDLTGRTLSSRDMPVNGTTTVNLNTSSFISGMYFVTISNPEMRKTLKFFR
ncbi:MAG: hypothetical protein C0592_04300 [Marinilabiliales bacterium]|nr:MAG: hypothetical protein C0592_04300 [Marinilabiliales bacterium]